MSAETRSYYYRYKITNCSILIPNTDPVVLSPSNILGFTIEKDFDNDHFPIFNLQLSLNFPQYYNIINNKTTVKFKVRLEKYIYRGESSIQFTEVVFDTLFAIFVDDNGSFLNKDLYNTTLQQLGSVENRAKYDFYLFRDDFITASKKIINRVVSYANMTDCIAYLLSASGSTNVLMTPLDNKNYYNEIILPPLTVIQSIMYLEKHFGFYEHGALLFYDFDTIYCINKRAACTAYRSGEYTDVIVQVFKSLSFNAETPGNYKDNKTKTYTVHVTRDNTEMLTSSIVADQTQGTNVTVIDPKNNTTTTINPSVQARNNTTTNIVNNFNNSFTNKMIENAKYENDNIVIMSVADVDLACFAPNKKFLLSFEDAEVNARHKGNYRLSYSLFTFIKNGDYFTVDGQIQFKKTT